MMVGRLSRIAFGLALVPSLALAQRGIMPGGSMGTGGVGRRGGRGPGSLAREQGIAIPKIVNAVNLLIENKQALSLTDTQFVRIIAMKRALDSTNAPLMRKLDSVQHVFKGGAPLFGDPSPARRDSLVEARGAILDVQGTVKDNIAAVRDKAYALLSSSQLMKARELEDKAEKAIADEEKEKEKSRGRGA
jgi:hypothetical protein